MGLDSPDLNANGGLFVILLQDLVMNGKKATSQEEHRYPDLTDARNMISKRIGDVIVIDCVTVTNVTTGQLLIRQVHLNGE